MEFAFAVGVESVSHAVRSAPLPLVLRSMSLMDDD